MESFKKELCCSLKEFVTGSRKSMWACRRSAEGGGSTKGEWLHAQAVEESISGESNSVPTV